MAISTAMCTSFKSELLSGGHCFTPTISPTFTIASGAVTATTVSSVAGLVPGQTISCATAGLVANTVITRILSNASFEVSKAATAAITGGTATILGDVFNMALIRGGLTGTYDATKTNYSDLGSADEVTGTGYTAGGAALSVSASHPTTGGTTAWITFSNPQWTSATFSTAGCVIYNSSVRLGGTSGTNTSGGGRAVGFFDFGGVQSVSSGTLTVLMPGDASGTAIVRLA